MPGMCAGVGTRVSLPVTVLSLCQGIAKFLAACKNETQSLEAAKNLQLGQLRLDMLKFEVNKLRRGRGSPVRKQGNPSYAAVSLSDIRLPLLWRPRDHMQVGGLGRSRARAGSPLS